MKKHITTIAITILIVFLFLCVGVVYAMQPSERDLQNQRLGQIQNAQEVLNQRNETLRTEVEQNSKLWNALNTEPQGIEQQLGFMAE